MKEDRPVVLWVDDDALQIGGAVGLLQLHNITVVWAPSFSEAIQRILNEPRLDLAILDVRVPLSRDKHDTIDENTQRLFELEAQFGKWAGPTLAKFISTYRPELPFIGMSAVRDTRVVGWFEINGAGYIDKSRVEDEDALIELITPHLRTSRVLPITHDPRNGLQMAPVHLKEDRLQTMTKAAYARETERLKTELHRLELEYDLARKGLGKLRGALLLTVGAVVFLAILGFVANMFGRREFLSGINIVLIVGTVALALVAFGAMIYGRSAQMKAQISKTRKELDIVLGRSVR